MRASLIQAFATLRQGETVPFSRFPAEWVDELLSEGGVSSIVRGSRKSLKVVSRAAFDVYLRSKGLQPERLEETVEVLSGADSRAQQVQLVGDSKAVAVRSCPGFPVNVTGPLSVRLGERKILLCPCPGSFLYISDFLQFRISSDAIVVGVENMENFRLPERQTAVWEEIAEQFGTEFYRYLGAERSAFFVPSDLEQRLATSGSRERYQVQFERFGKMDVPDSRLLPLVSLLHRHQKGYDQEGYITGSDNYE